jgi:hypothetical protein
VPHETKHANGATGIAALTIAVRDLEAPSRLGALLGASEPLERGIRFVSNGHRLDFVTPGADADMAHHIGRRRLGGVFSLSLKTAGAGSVIDPAEAQGARLSLVHA